MIRKNSCCRICHSKRLTKFLSLGKQPLANGFLRKRDLQKKEIFYPLEVYFCHRCNLVQLLDIVDKEEIFRDYVYFTSGMPRISDHFRRYAEYVIANFLVPGDLVLEIGSNDGILLKFFKERSFKVLGVDPAKNIAAIANTNGIPTISEFFSQSLAKQILGSHGKAKAILANNVVAHINDHYDLCLGVKELLADDGVFVFEAPYLIDMFENLTYDTIYHEHLSYLAVRPLIDLFTRFGLEIFDIHIVQAQGQSLRAFVGHQGQYSVKPIVKKLIRKELDFKMDKLTSYQKLTERIQNSKRKLSVLLHQLKKKNKKIAAYGAPAKGNTLLNYCQIGTDILDYALDDLPSKQGLYTPGMHIPVVDREYTRLHFPDHYLLLAWNYLQPILAKEKEYRSNGGKFIVPVGDRIRII